MKEKATIIAVSGSVLIGLSLVIYSAVTKQAIDAELMKQLFAGLLGFAGGAGSGVVVATALSTKTNTENE